MNRRHFLKHVAGYSALALPGLQFLRTIQANAQELAAQQQERHHPVDGRRPRHHRHLGPQARPADRRRVPRHRHHRRRRPDQRAHAEVAAADAQPDHHPLATTTEGDHKRGTQLMHTSYTPNPAIAFPSLGAVAAHEFRSWPATATSRCRTTSPSAAAGAAAPASSA